MSKYLLVHNATDHQDFIRTYLIESDNGVTIMYSNDMVFKNVYNSLDDTLEYDKVWSKDSDNALYVHTLKNWVLFKCTAKSVAEVVVNYLDITKELTNSNKLLGVLR